MKFLEQNIFSYKFIIKNLKYISRCHNVLGSCLKWKKLISCTLCKHGITAVVICGILIRLSNMFLHVVFSIIMEEYRKKLSRIVPEKKHVGKAHA